MNLAERITKVLGSWQFIKIQTAILVLWVVANVIPGVPHWDPYPFILLNLALSFQAAYAGPVILMAQNRQDESDRQVLRHLEQMVEHLESARDQS